MRTVGILGTICLVLAFICVAITHFGADSKYFLWAIASAYLGLVFAGLGLVLLIAAFVMWRRCQSVGRVPC